MFKQKNGITLVALIITVIVLLILAGVAINMGLGENGIIGKAQNAVDKYKTAANNEQELMKNIYEYIDKTYQVGNTRNEEEELKASVLEMVYPIGSIYMSMSSTNPSNFIGGTWEQIGQGRTLMGEGTNGGYTFTAGSTGTTVGAEENPLGEYMHQLTIPEMPSHTHGLEDGGNIIAHSTNHNFADSTWVEQNGFVLGSPNVMMIGKKNETSISSTGGNTAHNIIQPYIVTYMWKRIR